MTQFRRSRPASLPLYVIYCPSLLKSHVVVNCWLPVQTTGWSLCTLSNWHLVKWCPWTKQQFIIQRPWSSRRLWRSSEGYFASASTRLLWGCRWGRDVPLQRCKVLGWLLGIIPLSAPQPSEILLYRIWSEWWMRKEKIPFKFNYWSNKPAWVVADTNCQSYHWHVFFS